MTQSGLFFATQPYHRGIIILMSFPHLGVASDGQSQLSVCLSFCASPSSASCLSSRAYCFVFRFYFSSSRVASRDRTGFRGHHRPGRHWARSSLDERRRSELWTRAPHFAVDRQGFCCRDSMSVGTESRHLSPLQATSAKVQRLMLAEGILWRRRRARDPLGKLTCMWEGGVCLGVKATTR